MGAARGALSSRGAQATFRARSCVPQMHIHITKVQGSLQEQLYIVANHPGGAWTYIACPPGATHQAPNCK